jgi:pyruvate/2-oxoglutarate dehydrogenase complex dihydrolipoamide dehydrogenase (E3) component
MAEHAYDLVVVGAGSGGLTAAYVAANMGLRVALVEREKIGGDCTWYGCVPSKSLIKAAKVAHEMRTANAYGLEPTEPHADLSQVMARVQRIIDTIYEEETPEAVAQAGIEVHLGHARFVDSHSIQVGEVDTIRAKKFVLATGAHPFKPSIEGLDETPFFTYLDIWQLEELPKRLLVLGGGPIGAEMAQAFNRLGSQVTLLEGGDRVLPRDEPEASRVLAETFEAEGMTVHCQCRASKIWEAPDGIHVQAACGELVGDALLVAVGRRPNVDGLDLEKAGVAYTSRGIAVDRNLRTTASNVYALGDCIGSYQFTHYANWQAFMAVRNAVLPGKSVGHADIVPWTTFTEPEVAHVGLSEAAAREAYGDKVEVSLFPMSKVDRAHAENDTSGFLKLVFQRGLFLPKLLGVTIVAGRAGEMIQEWVMILQSGVSPTKLTRSIHVYPTYTRANTQALGPVLSGGLTQGRLGGLVKKVVRFLNR